MLLRAIMLEWAPSTRGLDLGSGDALDANGLRLTPAMGEQSLQARVPPPFLGDFALR